MARTSKLCPKIMWYLNHFQQVEYDLQWAKKNHLLLRNDKTSIWVKAECILTRFFNFLWTMTSRGHFFSKWANSSGHFLSTRILRLGWIFVDIFWVNSSGQFLMVITKSVHENSPILSTKIHLLCPREVCHPLYKLKMPHNYWTKTENMAIVRPWESVNWILS